MPIDRGPWTALVDDDGSNLVGSIWNKAQIASVLLDPIDASLLPLQANWIDIPFSAGNFGSVGGSWAPTAGSAFYAYAFIGHTLMLTLAVTDSAVGGTPSQLTLWNPIAAGDLHTIGPVKVALGSGGWEAGLVHALPGSQAIAITRPTLLNFPAGPTQVYLTIPIGRR